MQAMMTDCPSEEGIKNGGTVVVDGNGLLRGRPLPRLTEIHITSKSSLYREIKLAHRTRVNTQLGKPAETTHRLKKSIQFLFRS